MAFCSGNPKKTLRGTGCGVKQKVVELLADAKISQNFLHEKNHVRKICCKNYQAHCFIFSIKYFCQNLPNLMASKYFHKNVPFVSHVAD